jgi:hypothetical protein
MQHLSGRLKDGDRILFDGLTGYLEDQGGPSPAGGRSEIHQGGLLANHLPADHPYRLELEDGRAGTIEPTTVHATNSAGIAYLEYRPVGELGAEA